MFNLRRATPVVRNSVRAYAAAANNGQPPIQLFGIDGTYASALYTASAKGGNLDAVASAFAKLEGILKSDPTVAQLISNPTLSNEDKTIVVDVLSKSFGGEKSVTNLIKVMSENNRLYLLPQVGDAFASLIAAEKGEVEVTITSAQPLESKVLKQLESSISKSKFAGAGKKLKVVNKVNGDILGGLVVEVGDRTIDLSVSNRITRLNKMLTDSV